jgi:hypothetical protein
MALAREAELAGLPCLECSEAAVDMLLLVERVAEAQILAIVATPPLREARFTDRRR